jgi:hypothetical protein
MVKENLQRQSSSPYPFCRVPQSLMIFAEMRKWMVCWFILVLGGFISVKLHGLNTHGTLGSLARG